MADTGADAADMGTQVQAYRMSMTALVKKVLPMGGYWCDTTHWARNRPPPTPRGLMLSAPSPWIRVCRTYSFLFLAERGSR